MRPTTILTLAPAASQPRSSNPNDNGESPARATTEMNIALTSSPALRPEIPAWRLTPPIRLGSWAECLTALLVSPEALLPACPAVGRLRDKSLVATSSDIGSLREPGAILPRRERRGLPRILVTTLVAVLLAAAPAARAQESKPAEPAAQSSESGSTAATKDEIKALLEEIRRLKLELGLRDVEYQSYAGMGPAAAKVYFAPKGLSIGGYGEAYYQNNLKRHTSNGALVTNRTDLYRVVLYTGYRFSPKIVFNSEVEFEHQNEIHVEFAYLDFLFTDALRLRAGSVLVPLGFVNEMHEPPFFNGVLRPELETNLIPATWNENGVGLHGQLGGGLRYKLYGLTGLVGTNKSLRTDTWLRAARGFGRQAPASTYAGVASLAWEGGPVSTGAGFYHGRAGQGARDAQGYIDAEVTLAEAHAQLALRGLTVRGIVAHGWLSDTARIAAFQATAPAGPAVAPGKQVRGAYAEVAYDVLSVLASDSAQALSPFVRFEDIDLHHSVAPGLARSAANDYTVLTAGLTYKPQPTVVAKLDYSRKDTEATIRPRSESVNVGVGFVF